MIKHKKALSDIRTALNRGDYSGADAFIADVGLIVSNCFTYNCGNLFVIQVSYDCESSACLPTPPSSPPLTLVLYVPHRSMHRGFSTIGMRSSGRQAGCSPPSLILLLRDMQHQSPLLR